MTTKLPIPALLLFLLSACSSDPSNSKEEIRLEADTLIQPTDTASANTLDGSVSLQQLSTYPRTVVLTGLPDQRLVTIYKKVPDANKNLVEKYASRSGYYYDDELREQYTHYMPGLDLQLGYNLVNIAHYNFATDKTKLLFDQPVIVRSLYYPSFEQDSLNKKPINRDYFLVSVYNENTNKDTVLNKRDLRRFIHFNGTATEQKLLIPADYSVERSTYDSMRDVMYLYARHDANKDGKADKTEPVHVFWISLKKPEVGKRVY